MHPLASQTSLRTPHRVRVRVAAALPRYKEGPSLPCIFSFSTARGMERWLSGVLVPWGKFWRPLLRVRHSPLARGESSAEGVSLVHTYTGL